VDGQAGLSLPPFIAIPAQKQVIQALPGDAWQNAVSTWRSEKLGVRLKCKD